MSALLVLLLLQAAPKAATPTPRAPADAEWAYFIPRLEAAADLVPFLDTAGERSVLLRRESWRNEVHPLLRVDVTRRESLTEAGLDPAGSGTLSFRGDLSFSCVSLADVKKYEAACAERLKTLGEPWRKEVDGVMVVGARDPIGRVLAGYVLRGKESCAVGGHGNSVEKPLNELGKLLIKAPAGAMWKAAVLLPGQAMVVAPQAVLGLKGKGLVLTAEYKSSPAQVAKLAGPGDSPYAGVAYDGMLWARLRIEPTNLPPVLAQAGGILSRLCPGCDRATITDIATALAPTLSGNVLLYAQQVKLQGTLRTFNGRYFAVKQVVLAEAIDPKAARAALEHLAKLKGDKALDNGEGHSLLLREGELKLGLRGAHLYFANDGASLDKLLAALPAAPSRQAHGAEYGIDPERVAKGLGQVPVVDVLAVPELAGLVAASAEGGPLMLASEKLTGYADVEAGGAVRGQLTWTLKPRN